MKVGHILGAGILVVVISLLPALFFLSSPKADPYVPRFEINDSGQNSSAAHFHLPLRSDFGELSVGASCDQISFSIDPVRPDRESSSTRFLIRLKESRQMKRVEMNSIVRVGLAFNAAGSLQFSEDLTQYWLECQMGKDGRLQAALFYRTPKQEVVSQAQWFPSLMETPIQGADEFAEGHPFRELAESRFWGQDLLIQKVQTPLASYRVEVGPSVSSALIDCKVGDWLVYRGKAWEKCATLDSVAKESLPLAHIRSGSAQSLEIEGWYETSHVRLKLNLMTSQPFKIKPEELFSQLRVRSEKQVSCMMDKQCLVLRPGDWVIKVGARWKALKKVEEKEALLRGDLIGELFILEKIGVTPNSKNIIGSYFSAGRTQSIPVEVAQRAQKNRKAGR